MKGLLKLYSPINELKQLDKNIWIVDGTEIQMNFKVFKIPFTTRMTIVRLFNNKLWIHSPIAFNEELDDKIKELGEIAYIVAPNKYHYSYILDWYKHYPKAEIWLAKGVSDKLKVKEKEKFISLTANCQPIWSEEILFTPFKGSIVMEENVFFHKESSTLILTDLIENIEVNKLPFFISFYLESEIINTQNHEPLEIYAYLFFLRKKLLQVIILLKSGEQIKLSSLMEELS
ncbi:DUF4336 domain-containing protein [Streptococcus merionis]|uniref:DUF4336 domain-containing protein n=1 Tax=Streptococcus merionis TaxID=400065 RepID=A0A239SSU7_9STRE|nr:DUF4336 domain-containing protein [Streptococcus merionis]SNU88487.1 Uncharacterised protein [Streptococcus merionis]